MQLCTTLLLFTSHIFYIFMNTLTTNIRRYVFAVLCMALATVMMHATVSAKECEEGNCKGIKIGNDTDYSFSIKFLLCCDGELKETSCKDVPPGVSTIEFPEGCTILKWGFCNRLTPRICSKWYEDECVLKIYYCN